MSSLGTFFDSTQVIVLKRSKVRRKLIPGSFAAVNTQDYSVFDAIDGSTLDVQQMLSNGELIPRREGPNLGKMLTHGEIGCLMSHQGIWRSLLASKSENVLVCEGDIRWKENAIKTLGIFFSEISTWDIVYLHSHFTVDERSREHVAENCYIAEAESGGTLCYALNRRVAKYLLELSTPMQYAADGVTNWASADWDGGGKRLGFKSYLCYPFPCEPLGDDSTVGHKASFTKKIFNRMRRMLGHK